jgi:uncharacterized protein with ATP-grasp and redox domains
MGMTRQVADLVAGNDPGLRARAESVAREMIGHARDRNLTSPEAANQILRKIHQLSGVSDPFAQFKHNEMAGAARIFSMPGILPL